MARKAVEESVSEFDRNFRHVLRDVNSLIRKSHSPMPVKIRKHAGMQIRTERMANAINGLLSAFYDVWAELEDRAEHESAKVSEFRNARVLGAKRKLQNDPTQVAKAAAVSLWPIARQKGWTAVKFHNELVQRGHSVSPDTMRKWLTAFRKEGR
jgi:hypothetical protein